MSAPSSKRPLTRREWIETGIVVGAAAAATAVEGWAVLRLAQTILPAPKPINGIVEDRLVYTRFPTDQWWNPKAGTAVRVTDFAEWQGASAVWRGLFRADGTYVPGTGFPALVIRVVRDDAYFRSPDPSPYGLPAGFNLFFDDPLRNIRIVALFDRCTHLCCYPGWHVVSDPPPPRDYTVSPPTYDVYRQDPVYCVCHDSQFDPLLLVADVNPLNNVGFVGAQVVHPPARYSMPVIPIRAVSDELRGGMADPAWYMYC